MINQDGVSGCAGETSYNNSIKLDLKDFTWSRNRLNGPIREDDMIRHVSIWGKPQTASVRAASSGPKFKLGTFSDTTQKL